MSIRNSNIFHTKLSLLESTVSLTTWYLYTSPAPSLLPYVDGVGLLYNNFRTLPISLPRLNRSGRFFLYIYILPAEKGKRSADHELKGKPLANLGVGRHSGRAIGESSHY